MPHSNTINPEEIAMLRSELELLMVERSSLLRVVGAAAALVANLDSERLPEESWEAAELLAGALNTVPEESLRDALDVVKAEIEGDAAG